jgi:hypothetical protein
MVLLVTRSTRVLGAGTVVDQVGDGADLEAVFAGEGDQLGQAGHGAVVVHDLADDRRRFEAGHAGKVDSRLRCGRRGPARRRAGGDRKDVAGLDDVVGSRRLVLATATWMVRARSAAEMPVVTPSAASIETVKAVPVLRLVVARHLHQAELACSAPRSGSGRSGRGRAWP